MDKDNLILNHLGRYTLSIRPIMDELFFDGGSCSASLKRLGEKQLVQPIKNTLQGNYSYYQLTPKGAKTLGLPLNRATSKRETALAQNLAALWFCCKGGAPRRTRLNDEELNSLFGAPEGSNVIHVAQNADDEQTTVFRLFIPAEGTSVRTEYVRSLQKSAVDAMTNQRLRPWIERGTYRFAVLVHSEVRREELERFIRRREFPKLRIQIDTTPTPTTLPLHLPDKEQD
jgi:hypothetical protein